MAHIRAATPSAATASIRGRFGPSKDPRVAKREVVAGPGSPWGHGSQPALARARQAGWQVGPPLVTHLGDQPWWHKGLTACPRAPAALEPPWPPRELGGSGGRLAGLCGRRGVPQPRVGWGSLGQLPLEIRSSRVQTRQRAAVLPRGHHEGQPSFFKPEKLHGIEAGHVFHPSPLAKL